ncbi:efflux RND transporter periplasmic adaptor subunit [Arenimonas caeni]|jgi:HlyD family secretion protein|uniref:efflux RND transporter periplasmic adaptor subunit n=1 Tax=Arenimonas caeni TaxID=2058085 RepID=UPI002A369150|nr:efflux RND transporter periplasmic adaptor subunit [Arenimonas caeni]MDY0021913.1 efflux RND transporter periplasmic adaptor subunit [Arenimonas caeni]
MTRRRLALLVLPIAALAGGLALGSLRGPVLDAYEIGEAPLVQAVVATGRVVSVSRAQAGSAITGVVLERRVREGDRVAPGDVLAVLRADDLDAAVREAEAGLHQLLRSARPQAEAALQEARARLAQASREAERRRELFDRQLIAREALEQALEAEVIASASAERARLAAHELAEGGPAERAARARLASTRAQLEKTLIRAEAAGTVITRNVEPGDLVQPGRVLFEIARDGDTEVLVPLDERNLGVLALDQPARCVADAFPGQPFDARVSFIAPGVDAQRGSVDIRLTVSPVPEFLRQDMTVSVNVETGRRERSLVVPNDALGAIDGDRAEVWRVAGGRVERRVVRLGLRGLAASEVVEGLQAGDLVLADATAPVAAGDRVRARAAGAPADAADPATRKELPAALD